jgi:hypothetical protein
MKRLNNYLLTHHPLLWNLRVHYIWPVILLLHLFFFIGGYSSVRFPEISGYERLYPREDTMILAILMGVLAMVGWLVLYFRNNAFKSFLPLKPGRLVAEMALIFATAFGLASIAVSSAHGKAQHIRQLSRNTDLDKEQETIALALQFLPFNLETFSRFNNADEQLAVDTVQLTTLNNTVLPVDTFSYLNFNGQTYYRGDRAPVLAVDIHKRAAGWLKAGRRDSVLRVLQNYLKLVKKYGGKYRFDPAAHVQAIFSRADFAVRYTIAGYDLSQYGEEQAAEAETAAVVPVEGEVRAPALRYAKGFAYISRENPEWGIRQVEAARYELLDWDVLVFLLYAALAVTILIFGFRLTEGRTWGIAVIGAGLLTVIIGLMIAVSRGAESALVLLLIIEAAFTTLAMIGISTGWKRRWAGVLYLWSLAGMPFVLPLIWQLLQQISQPDYDSTLSRYEPSALYDWLRASERWFVGGNLILSLALLAVFYIPLARRWQAMTEE